MEAMFQDYGNANTALIAVTVKSLQSPVRQFVAQTGGEPAFLLLDRHLSKMARCVVYRPDVVVCGQERTTGWCSREKRRARTYLRKYSPTSAWSVCG
jgi:hypothetical protein